MKLRSLLFIAVFVASAIVARSQAPVATSADIAKRVEAYLRNLYAWGPEFAVKIGAATLGVTDLLVLPVEVTANNQTDSAIVYVSKDGRYMFRGEIQDLSANPLDAVRRQLQLDGYASKGPQNAAVTIVEFADFQCPSCRQFDLILREVAAKYPQVRIVFKDFPLEQIHPWALTAAIAGRCALQKSPEVFWKFHDAVYDSQDVISPENAYAKLTDIAAAAGADSATFKTCLADPNSRIAVQKSMEEGSRLHVNSTPTSFVNGRQLEGPDVNLLQQYLDFDTGVKSPHP